MILSLDWRLGRGHTKIPEEDAGVVPCRRDIGEESLWEMNIATVGLDAGSGLAKALGGFVRYRGPWVVLGDDCLEALRCWDIVLRRCYPEDARRCKGEESGPHDANKEY